MTASCHKIQEQEAEVSRAHSSSLSTRRRTHHSPFPPKRNWFLFNVIWTLVQIFFYLQKWTWTNFSGWEVIEDCSMKDKQCVKQQQHQKWKHCINNDTPTNIVSSLLKNQQIFGGSTLQVPNQFFYFVKMLWTIQSLEAKGFEKALQILKVK